jgi:hypothetical protein
MDLSKDLIDSSRSKWDGITIRYPDRHAMGIELGILAVERMMQRKQWRPDPGPPLWWILCFGGERGSALMAEKGESRRRRRIRQNARSKNDGFWTAARYEPAVVTT